MMSDSLARKSCWLCCLSCCSNVVELARLSASCWLLVLALFADFRFPVCEGLQVGGVVAGVAAAAAGVCVARGAERRDDLVLFVCADGRACWRLGCSGCE